ncbi:hypothetical protein Bca4012_019138 [Brassica carinata]
MVPISLSPILGFRSDLMSRTIIENPIFGQFLLAHHQSFRRRHCSDSAHVNTEAPPTMRNASFALKQGEREIKVRTFDFSILQKERERSRGISRDFTKNSQSGSFGFFISRCVSSHSSTSGFPSDKTY